MNSKEVIVIIINKKVTYIFESEEDLLNIVNKIGGDENLSQMDKITNINDLINEEYKGVVIKRALLTVF